VYYAASADIVEFQLEVTDNSGHISKDSVMVLLPKPQRPVLPDARTSPAKTSNATVRAGTQVVKAQDGIPK
jgi:hypothetical protein